MRDEILAGPATLRLAGQQGDEAGQVLVVMARPHHIVLGIGVVGDFQVSIKLPIGLRKGVGGDRAHAGLRLEEVLEGEVAQVAVEEEKAVEVSESRSLGVDVVTRLGAGLLVEERLLVPVDNAIVVLAEEGVGGVL